MSVQLAAAGPERADTLRNLLQLYEYDWSEIGGRAVVDEQGLYPTLDPDTFLNKPGAHAFLIRVDGELAGFVLVVPHSYFGHPDTMLVEEFFVMRRYRRAGVGAEAATRVFEMFPGGWEVSETGSGSVSR